MFERDVAETFFHIVQFFLMFLLIGSCLCGNPVRGMPLRGSAVLFPPR